MAIAYTSSWATEDLRILRESTRRFLAKEFTPHFERWRYCKQVDRDAWRKAGAAGLLCASIPEAYGGGGGHFGHEAVIVEELERCGIGVGFGNVVHSGIVAHYILAYGTEEQKQRWLPQLASGECVSAIAMTEPNTGSDLQSIATKARRVEGGYLLSGQKTFITNGILAELVIVAAKIEEAKKLSLFVVETKTCKGFRRGRSLDKIGLKASDTAELYFDDAFVPLENLLGGETGQGMAQLMQQLPRERLLLAIGAVAAMERALDLAIEYTKERQAFGRPLIDFQNTNFRLAERKTETHIARIFIDYCISQMISGSGIDATTASMAKWWCTEKQGETIDACLQFFGGYGYMAEFPIAQMFVDSRVQRIYGGTTEIMKLVVARSL